MVKVSIIMSSYNHEGFIKRCIDSVLNQTLQDFEFIIFDDCSTDNTYKIASSYTDPRIKLFKAPYNRGMVHNINEAIGLAKGEYIANLNSDDFWDLCKLEKQVKFLDENPDYGAVFTGVNLINSDDKILNGKVYPYFENVVNKNCHQWLNHFFYKGNTVCFSSSMIRKSCYDVVGLYNPAYIVLLDFDMWIRICFAKFEIYVLEERLVNFRITNGELNLGRTESKIRSWIEENNIFGLYFENSVNEDFFKIFPEIFNKESPNKKYELLRMVSDECSRLSSLKEITKEQKRTFKRLSYIKEFVTLRFFEEIKNKNLSFDLIRDVDAQFGFKRYLQIMSTSKRNIHSIISHKNKRLIFKAYFVISLLAIVALLIVAF